MTREEAIEKYILPAVHHHWNEKVCKEIEQILKQEPCEEDYPRCTECKHYDKEKHHCPRFCAVIKDTLADVAEQESCDDCISRQAVLNIINERKFVHTMEYGEYIGEDSRQDELLYAGTVRNIVLALPSIEPTRPHGE